MKVKYLVAAALSVAVCGSAFADKKPKKDNKKNAKTEQKAAAAADEALKPVDGQTFSYALGVVQGESLRQYLISQAGVDSAYVDVALDAMTEHPSDEVQKRAKAYAVGLQLSEMNARNLPMISKGAAGNDSTYVSQQVFEQSLKAAAQGRATITRDSAMKVVEGQFKYHESQWKKQNEAYLVAKGKEKGVKTLKSGLMYSVRTQGTGAVATDSSDVEVHYEGKLIDGTVFDSSYKRGKAATFKPSQVIKGWKEALTMMPEGSIWELYIPSELGYGERGQGAAIPGNSTLVFTVEVLKVK